MPSVLGRYIGKTRSLSCRLLGKTGRAGRLIMRTAVVGNELVLKPGLLRLGEFGALRGTRRRRNGVKGRKPFKKVQIYRKLPLRSCVGNGVKSTISDSDNLVVVAPGANLQEAPLRLLTPCISCPSVYLVLVQIYRKLPLRLLSRLWGHIHKAQLPVWMRGPLFRLYIWLFDCNLQEAAIEDLTHYSNLNEFFRRQLKPSVRTIDQEHSLVSPADGTVLHFGKVEHNMLEQVKGVTYSLQTFLGRTNNNWWLSKQATNNSKPQDDENYQQMLLENPEENELYHCTVYLAPGDYHRFHSPAEWEVLHRRHFPGELFSVNPGLVRCIQGLFNYNERVVMSGRWDQGFFSMSAVGATNVGSIRMYMDSRVVMSGRWDQGFFSMSAVGATNVGSIRMYMDSRVVMSGRWDQGFFSMSAVGATNVGSIRMYMDSVRVAHNLPGKWKGGLFYDRVFFNETQGTGVSVKKGEIFGEFNLGSSIVIIFEAPRTFSFKVKPGQKIRFGEPLGCSAETDRTKGEDDLETGTPETVENVKHKED
ncbi:hypothetical protein Bbelb_169490 [Branchiostoma belcheri]|nr:hypothetical protein Bbelb_169490 [Branchiostoma belcheri]